MCALQVCVGMFLVFMKVCVPASICVLRDILFILVFCSLCLSLLLSISVHVLFPVAMIWMVCALVQVNM